MISIKIKTNNKFNSGNQRSIIEDKGKWHKMNEWIEQEWNERKQNEKKKKLN